MDHQIKNLMRFLVPHQIFVFFFKKTRNHIPWPIYFHHNPIPPHSTHSNPNPLSPHPTQSLPSFLTPRRTSLSPHSTHTMPPLSPHSTQPKSPFPSSLSNPRHPQIFTNERICTSLHEPTNEHLHERTNLHESLRTHELTSSRANKSAPVEDEDELRTNRTSKAKHEN